MSKLAVPSAGRLKTPPHDDRKGSPLLYTAGTTSMRRSIVVTPLAVVMPRGGRHGARRASWSAAGVMERGGRHGARRSPYRRFSPRDGDRKGSPLLYTAGTTSMRRSIVVTPLAGVMPRGGRHGARRASWSAAVIMPRGGRHGARRSPCRRFSPRVDCFSTYALLIMAKLLLPPSGAHAER